MFEVLFARSIAFAGKPMPPEVRSSQGSGTSALRVSIVAVMAMTACTPVWAQAGVTACPGPQPVSGLTTTFESNFAQAAALDFRQWVPYSGVSLGNPALEAQTYASSQVVITGRGLRLSVRPQPGQERPFLAGAITTKGRFSQAYGHFEMMARMPQANGLWPAFWLLPATGEWPPEIDVVEYVYAPNGVLPAADASAAEAWRGSNPATTLHWGSASHHSQTAPGVGSAIPQLLTYQDWNTTPPPPGWSADYVGYHVYAVEWRPGSVVWAIDGRTVFCAFDSAATGPRVPQTPMFMLVNIAVSAGTTSQPLWPGFVDASAVWPQNVDVAYVRVAQFNDLAAGVAMSVRNEHKGAGPARRETLGAVNGKVGVLEASVLPALAADDAGLCASGAVHRFRENVSGWTWSCEGAEGGSTDPTGLAFRAANQ